MGSESENSEEGKFAKQGGEALDLGGDFNDSDVEEEMEAMKPQKPDGSGGKAGGPEKVAGKKLEN